MARKRVYEDARPKSDVYTGLLAISLVAMIASCVMLYLDYSQYPPGAPPKPAPLPTAAPKSVSAGQLPPPDRPPAAPTQAPKPPAGNEPPPLPKSIRNLPK